MSRLSQFAACMRKNGVNVPPPGTSSKGARLDLKGIDTTTQAYKKARARCMSKLTGPIRIGHVRIGGVKVKIGPVHVPAPKLQPPGGTIPGGASGAESR